MWLIILIVLCVALGCIYISLFDNTKENLPPKSKPLKIVKGIPIFGIFLQLKSELYDYLMNLSKKYGNIFTIKFGMRDIVVLNDYDVIKKTLKDDGENFSGMWRSKFREVVSNNTGILFIDGDTWFKQRSFLLKVLRDFGFGKSKSYEIVEGECKYLLDELDNLQGTKIDFTTLIPIYTANIISKFIMNKRFLRTDPRIKRIENAVGTTTKKRNLSRLLHLLFPILDNAKIITRLILWMTSLKKIVDDTIQIFEDERKKHLAFLDLSSEGEDLMDRFLIEQHRLIDKNGTPESFTDRQLLFLSFELFAAGYETTSTALGWSMLFMSKYPHVQKQVHDEIVENIGCHRLPTMNDKRLLIYTQAVMDEIIRSGAIVPQGFHRTLNDTTVNGFFLPKNSLIYINIYACLRDSRLWEKPSEFYPKHFLERSENGVLRYIPREDLIAFSIGKRKCLGESLARMEFFVFLVAILQKFKVRFSEDISEEQYQNGLKGNRGIIRFPKVKNYIFEKY